MFLKFIVLVLFSFSSLAHPVDDVVFRVSPDGVENNCEVVSDNVYYNPHSVFECFSNGRFNDLGKNGVKVVVDFMPGRYFLEKPLVLSGVDGFGKSNPLLIKGNAAELFGGIKMFQAGGDLETVDLVSENVFFGSKDFVSVLKYKYSSPSKSVMLDFFDYEGKSINLSRFPHDGYLSVIDIEDWGADFKVRFYGDFPFYDGQIVILEGFFSRQWAYEVADGIWSDGGVVIKKSFLDFGVDKTARLFFSNFPILNSNYLWKFDFESGRFVFLLDGLNGAVYISNTELALNVVNSSHIIFDGFTVNRFRGDGVVFEGVDNVVFSGGVISNVGRRGLVVKGVSSGISNSKIYNTGEGGVELVGGDRSTLIPGNNFVRSCDVYGFANRRKTYRPGVLIKGVGNYVVNSKIHDSSHSGIIFYGNDHVIHSNEFSNLVYDSGDAGVIYTGRDWSARGTLISNNFFYNIYEKSIGRVYAIYLDDQASGILVRGNIFHDVARGVFIGGGRNNLVEKNSFSQVGYPVMIDARGASWQKKNTFDSDFGLLKSLRRVPYTSALYVNRYPGIERILVDDPGVPKYNIVRDNFCVSVIYIGGNDESILLARQGVSVYRNLCD